MSSPQPFRIVLLLSGDGSNLQAIIDAIANKKLSLHIAAVISNRPIANGLNRARSAGIETVVIDDHQYNDREAYDKELACAIDAHKPDLIVLAGFMRILSDGFVNRYLGRLVNIHPSLLPKFKGLHTHRRALENHETVHGATVHYVTPQLDDGPIICQAQLNINKNETESSLKQRVHLLEHQLYPFVLSLIADGTIIYRNGHIYYQNEQLSHPLQFKP